MLPEAYAWLSAEDGPPLLTEAIALYGTAMDDETVAAWAEEVGVEAEASDDAEVRRKHLVDSVARRFAGLFMALVAHRSEGALPAEPLECLSWLDFGEEISAPMLGDVMIRPREVVLCLGEDALQYHVLGLTGVVSITRISKESGWNGFRRPAGSPTPNVRTVMLTGRGSLKD